MVIDYFYIVSVIFFPLETYSPLIIYSYTILITSSVNRSIIFVSAFISSTDIENLDIFTAIVTENNFIYHLFLL